MMASAKIALDQGMKCQNNKSYEKALIQYAMAVEASPKNKQAYKHRGKCFCELKNFTKAVEEYTIAISIDPKDL